KERAACPVGSAAVRPRGEPRWRIAMRKLIEATFVTLDGVIESPEKWAMPFFAGENKEHALAALADVDTLLLGRATYEKFVKAWAPIHGDPYFDVINALPKLVASTTLKEATWNAKVISGDVADAIAALKAQPGKNIMKYGTGSLDRALFQRGLIDELNLSIFPVVVGSGARLFGGFDASAPKLTLPRTKAFHNGAVVHTYVPR